MKASLRIIAILSLFFINSCGGDDNVDPIVTEEEIVIEEEETFDIISDQTSIKPLQFVLISSSEINFSKESYKATLGDIEIDLYKTVNNSLIFSVPELNPGSKKLKLIIDTKVGEFSFNVKENIVQNVDTIIKQELLDPMNEFESEISNLLTDNSYPPAIKDQLISAKKMLDDFLIKYNTSSDEEKMNIAKFFNSNPLLTSDYLNLSSKSNAKINTRYSGIINIIEGVAKATIIVIVSVQVLAPLLVTAFTATAAFLVTVGATVAVLASAVAVGAIIGAAIYKINNELLTPVDNQFSDDNGNVLGNKSSKSDVSNKQKKAPYKMTNDKQYTFNIVSNDRLLNSTDTNNSASDIVSLVENINKLDNIWNEFKNTVNKIISNSTNFFSSWMGSSSSTYKPITYEFNALPNTTPIIQGKGNSEFITITGFPSDVEVEYSEATGNAMNLKLKTDETTLPRVVSGNIVYNDGVFTNSSSFSIEITPKDLVLEKVSGDNQNGEKNKALENPIIVKVVDEDGNIVKDIDIVFNITAGQGSVSNSSIKTDTEGLAKTNWTLGDNFEEQTLEASIRKTDGSLISTLNFKAKPVVPTTLEIDSGNNQTGEQGEKLDETLKVLVKDNLGNLMSDITVYFFVKEGGGSVTETDISIGGFAEASWTLGNNPNTQTVEANIKDTSGNIIDNVLFTSNPILVPSTIEIVSGNNQTDEKGKQLAEPLKVLVKDNSGNLMDNVTVYFSIKTGGGSISQTDNTSNGIAEARWTLGNNTDAQTVEASIKDSNNNVIDFVEFKAESTEKEYFGEIISGNNQVQLAGKKFDDPIVYKVIDANGLPAQGIELSFLILSSDGSYFSESNSNSILGRNVLRKTNGSGIIQLEFVATWVKPGIGRILVLNNDSSINLNNTPDFNFEVKEFSRDGDYLIEFSDGRKFRGETDFNAGSGGHYWPAGKGQWYNPSTNEWKPSLYIEFVKNCGDQIAFSSSTFWPRNTTGNPCGTSKAFAYFNVDLSSLDDITLSGNTKSDYTGESVTLTRK